MSLTSNNLSTLVLEKIRITQLGEVKFKEVPLELGAGEHVDLSRWSLALTDHNLEHLSLEWIVAAQVTNHARADLGRETSFDELILILRAYAVQVLLESRLREHLERPLFIQLGFLRLLHLLLVVEDLPKVFDTLAEARMEVWLLKQISVELLWRLRLLERLA